MIREKLRAWVETVDWLEAIGFGCFVLLSVGLWKLDEAVALVVVGAVGFVVTALALRNRGRGRNRRVK